MDWKHEWSDFFFTKTMIGYEAADYKGNGQTRQDDETQFGLDVGYLFDYWGMVSMAYDYEQRQSNEDANDYEQNKFMLNLMMAM